MDDMATRVDLPRLIDAKALAASGALPGLGAEALRQAARAGRLPCVRIGVRIWFNVEELRAFIAAGGRARPEASRRDMPAPPDGAVIVRRRRGRPRKVVVQGAPSGAGAVTE